MSPLNPFGFGADVPDPEFPSTEKLQHIGAFSFLYMRSPQHSTVAIWGARVMLQPPIDLGYYHIFCKDTVPRAAVTWAWFSPEVEQKFIAGQTLAPRDWRSGHQLWIIEMIAPYAQGSGASAMRWLFKAMPNEIKTLRYLRRDAAYNVRRIVEMQRTPENRVRFTQRDLADFSPAPTPNMTPDKIAPTHIDPMMQNGA